MNCKRLTGHGQDEMLFHCDSCHKNSLLDTYDVLTAADDLHCPLCGANADYLTVANEGANFKLKDGEAGPRTRYVSEEYISAAQHKVIAKAEDETAALDYIKSALVLDCCEEIISNDGQVVTDKEKQVIIARLLIKALAMFDDYEMQESVKHLNDEKHDEHTELLLKLIDHEYDKLRQERKDNDFLKKVTHNDDDD